MIAAIQNFFPWIDSKLIRSCDGLALIFLRSLGVRKLSKCTPQARVPHKNQNKDEDTHQVNKRSLLQKRQHMRMTKAFMANNT